MGTGRSYATIGSASGLLEELEIGKGFWIAIPTNTTWQHKHLITPFTNSDLRKECYLSCTNWSLPRSLSLLGYPKGAGHTQLTYEKLASIDKAGTTDPLTPRPRRWKQSWSRYKCTPRLTPLYRSTLGASHSHVYALSGLFPRPLWRKGRGVHIISGTNMLQKAAERCRLRSNSHSLLWWHLRVSLLFHCPTTQRAVAQCAYSSKIREAGKNRRKSQR